VWNAGDLTQTIRRSTADDGRHGRPATEVSASAPNVKHEVDREVGLPARA
jgi:hypothetical protein